MELAMSFHPINNFFIGAMPESLPACWTNYNISLGVSATILAKNRREGGIEHSQKGAKKLEITCHVLGMFKKRYCDSSDGPRPPFTLADINVILQKNGGQKLLDEGNSRFIGALSTLHSPIGESASSASCSNEAQVMNSPATLKKIENSARDYVEPVSLLVALSQFLDLEIPRLSFDYYLLHGTCWDLLLKIKEVLDIQLSSTLGPAYLDRDNLFQFVVGMIFMVALGTHGGITKVGLPILSGPKYEVLLKQLKSWRKC
ncbi:MAG: hypothetical protein M1814_000683 [Vezdaea aestivalis]|nr:MAG: hypothetical protein M1814_000683 [Vezdaea aestivalis]